MNIEKAANVNSVYDEGLFYRLFGEAELVRWQMTDYDWSSIKKSDVPPCWITVARESFLAELTTFSATERFLSGFADDVDFTQWISVWLYEETKHPSAILKWLDVLGEKCNSRMMLEGRKTEPFMQSKMGTLVSNVISEMVASTFYLTVGSQPTIEPIYKQICTNLSGDEARHGASFYSYARKRLVRSENPKKERLDALNVLYFWTNPELNARVAHPVNMLANLYKVKPELQQAVPLEALRSGVEGTYRRAIRVFGTLLGIELRDSKDVQDQVVAHQML